MNLYAYVGNDPINATDPTGRWGRVISAVGKVAIRTARYGGNIRRAGRETWAEVRNDAGAVVARDSTAGERLAGAFNILSPISTRDAQGIANWMMSENSGYLTPGGREVAHGPNSEGYINDKGWTPGQIDDLLDGPAESYENKRPNHRTGQRQTTHTDAEGNWVVVDEDGRITQVNERGNDRQPEPERKEEED